MSCTNKLEVKCHDDTRQHSYEYGQTDGITSSIDYQHPNRRLNFEKENKENPKFQVSTVPELQGSPLIRKSRSKSMSIPHRDPSSINQATPSINATMASAEDAGAPDSSASQSSSETNLPPIEPFVSTETTDTKVEVGSFETCVISQKTTIQESTGEAEQMDMENVSKLDLFSMPSGSHSSTVGSPITHLNNEKLHDKDAENAHEKEVDNLDALVNERTISLDLVTTQHLFRRASNFANEGKKRLVFGQDCNHIISVRLQINGGKRIQVEGNIPSLDTEGPATSVLRGISANRDCSKIIYANCKTNVVYCLQIRQRRSFKVKLNNFRSLLILGGVLISFEIMLNFAKNSRLKVIGCLSYCITTPSPLVSRHVSYCEP